MLRYGAASSCCLRRVTGEALGPSCSPPLRWEKTVTSALVSPSTASALCTPLRCRASTIRIANRKKVEMFVGKRYHLPTRLRTAAPDVAVEWDYDKNPMHLYPEIVSIGYMMPVFWQCKTCGHGYKMSVEKRVVRGGGCPVCEEGQESAATVRAAAAMESSDAAEGEKPALLPGEKNAALRPKRSTMLNLRTKY